MMLKILQILVLGTVLGFGSSAHGHDYKVADVTIAHPYALPTPAGATNGAAYLARLENTGTAAERLLRVSTPIAASAELHTMSVDSGGVMRMREVVAMALAPHTPIHMSPGSGLHLMLIGLKQPLKVGDRFAMTLEFERAGKVEVEVAVQSKQDAAATSHGGAHRH